MIKYEVKVMDAIIYVSLNTTNSNKTTLLLYEGESDAVGIFRNLLERAHGAFGHIIGSATTAIDLHYVMSNQLQFQATLIEGQDLVKNYDPGIPDGAVT